MIRIAKGDRAYCEAFIQSLKARVSENDRSVEDKVEKAMASFDFTGTGYCYDTTPGRIIYFYFNPERFWKYVRPVRSISNKKVY